MRRPLNVLARVALPAVAAIVAGAAIGLQAPSAAPFYTPAAPLPPDLVSLEQRMAALHFNTLRQTLQVELESKPGLLGPGTPPLVLLMAGTGAVSVSPEEGSFTLGFLGQTTEIREVGGETYRYDPSVARIDGGRSWVRSKATAPASSLAVGPAGLGEGIGASHGYFSGVLGLLADASAIQEAGPAIVDDQPVTEFTAAIDPRKLGGWRRLLGSGVGTLLKEPEGGGAAPSSRLELFLSPAGLPVRIRFALETTQGTASLTSDTLALEVPVSVIAPPANEVIDDARLKAIQRRQRARERARFKRTLRRRSA
jgi:hypothetical protein